ncbi:MAG: ABC1 kinase family protein [Candidatus Methylacidiphilales bacterium]|nr:AarF/ABC1/UbiB kinase family protein [Candidatus Methylacidiphilales bacterium]
MSLLKFGMLGRTYQHLNRYKDILSILFKYGYEDVLRRLGIADYFDSSFLRAFTNKEPDISISSLSPQTRLRLACEELGPAFVKMGQILSLRPDLLPDEYMDELAKLQDSVTPMPFEEVKTLLALEFNRPLEEIFEFIEPEQLAAASIAQVHKGRLVGGQEVAIKVQWPRLRHMIEVDLEILMHLGGLAERHVEGWRVHRPTAIINEVGKSLRREIDFKLEAAHMERFERQFENELSTRVPKVFHEASTERVLTMEYMSGVKISDILALREAGVDLPALATRLTDVLMKQIFVHGFFHADPHPGNVYVLPNAVVGFFDFGMMGHLDERGRQSFADLIWGIVERDQVGVSGALLKLSQCETEPSRLTLEFDVGEFIHRHFYRPVEEIEFGKLIMQLLQITSHHGLRMPPDLFILLKAMGMMEALVRELSPKHDLILQAAPFIAQVRLNRYNPNKLAQGMVEFGYDFVELARQMPSELRKIFSQLKTGETQFVFKHEGLEPLDKTLDRISNRISFAMVLAALIVGSSIIVHSQVPPKIYDIPIIGVIGFLIAGAMGFRLLLAILFHGRM